jgi:hypothetical protein
MVTERRAYPPIEGGQSLAGAEPIPKRGLFFCADLAGFRTKNPGRILIFGPIRTIILGWVFDRTILKAALCHVLLHGLD